MLCWQLTSDLLDIASLGGAGRHPRYDELCLMTGYRQILAVYDADLAGQNGQSQFEQYTRVKSISPPDHDLTDYWSAGGDLRKWIASLL